MRTEHHIIPYISALQNLSNTMLQNFTWKIDTPLFKNPKIHHHFHKSLSLNLDHTLTSHFSKINLILSSHLFLGPPHGIIPCGFVAKIFYLFVSSYISFPAQSYWFSHCYSITQRVKIMELLIMSLSPVFPLALCPKRFSMYVQPLE
jgi:hypothetical protein